jgi:hypothetical protein
MESHDKKLTISAYSDKKLKKKDPDQFVIPINPEQYAQTFKVKNDTTPTQGAQGSEARFKSAEPEQLKLDFVLDGTGTVYGYAGSEESVPKQLQKLKQTVYNIKGPIHQPRYVKLVWTDFTFDCKLSEMTVTFVLFDPEGTPLRAKVSATFIRYKETERRVREEGKSSPDLTHARNVTEADSLPLLTHEIYGKPDYYLEVARANGLTSCRRIPPQRRQLVFYPLDNTES